MAEWLRRWTANPMGSARVGSNPILVGNFSKVFSKLFVGQLLISYVTHMPPWRNWLARSAVNRKVGGSSPPGGAFLRSLAEPARTFFFPWEMFVPNEVKLSGPPHLPIVLLSTIANLPNQGQ